EFHCGFFYPAQRHQTAAHQDARRGIPGIEPDGFTELRKGSFVIAAFTVHNAEIVVNKCLLAALLDHREEGLLRRIQLTGFFRLYAFVEQLREGGRKTLRTEGHARYYQNEQTSHGSSALAGCDSARALPNACSASRG